MGDVLALVKQVQEKVDQEQMRKQEEQLRKGQFTLDDFRKMLGQVKNLGPLDKLMSLMPGMAQVKKMLGDADSDGELRRVGGIIDSMTKDERRSPKLIDQSRRRRIAAGAGVEPHEVNELVKQFDVMADIMKKMSGLGIRGRMQAVQELSRSGALNPGAKLAKQKVGTGKRLTSEERAKLKKLREREERRRKREEREKRNKPEGET
jgi:signal recognition particle subunit SRP54